MFWLNILLRNREINQMCECFLLQVQHTVFVQLDHSSICLWLNKKGYFFFFLKNLSFFQSSWYSSWHFGFRKLTGPGLGPISLRGWPGASRTFWRCLPYLPCLLPSSTMEGVHTCRHLFCPFFTFRHLPLLDSFLFRHPQAGWKWVRGHWTSVCIYSPRCWSPFKI